MIKTYKKEFTVAKWSEVVAEFSKNAIFINVKGESGIANPIQGELHFSEIKAFSKLNWKVAEISISLSNALEYMRNNGVMFINFDE